MSSKKEYQTAYKNYLLARDHLWKTRDKWAKQNEVLSALRSLIWTPKRNTSKNFSIESVKKN